MGISNRKLLTFHSNLWMHKRTLQLKLFQLQNFFINLGGKTFHLFIFVVGTGASNSYTVGKHCILRTKTWMRFYILWNWVFRCRCLLCRFIVSIYSHICAMCITTEGKMCNISCLRLCVIIRDNDDLSALETKIMSIHLTHKMTAIPSAVLYIKTIHCLQIYTLYITCSLFYSSSFDSMRYMELLHKGNSFQICPHCLFAFLLLFLLLLYIYSWWPNFFIEFTLKFSFRFHHPAIAFITFLISKCYYKFHIKKQFVAVNVSILKFQVHHKFFLFVPSISYFDNKWLSLPSLPLTHVQSIYFICIWNII